MTGTMRFENLLDLARLPYFEIRNGRLIVADPSVGPVIDAHTHLALSFVRRSCLDLEAISAPTQHYLPATRAVDLDAYANKNFQPDDLSRMRRDLTLKCLTGTGMRATHTVPNLEREMYELGISRALLLAIDFPFVSDNAGAYLRVAAGHPSLVCYGSVHPYSFGMTKKVDQQKAMGARGIKVHPATQMVRPDNPRCMKLYSLCGERNLPIFFHCGPVGIEPAAGRRRAQVHLYEAPIAEHPNTTFVLGHSGALQMEQALDLANRYKNTWLDLACQSLSSVRTILEKGPTDRIVFGTDWPFYHQAIGLAKVLVATEGDVALRRRVLHDNAARLLGD